MHVEDFMLTTASGYQALGAASGRPHQMPVKDRRQPNAGRCPADEPPPVLRLIANSGTGKATLDMAVSHALLVRVARGESESLIRIYRPQPTLAFSRRDVLSRGYQDAVNRAREHGFVPLVRLAGGRAVAYHGGTLIYEELTSTGPSTGRPCHELLAAAGRVREALVALGADAGLGKVSGEYCPGDVSVNLGGRVKVAGTAQRCVRGAILTSTAIVVGGGGPLCAVLEDVNRALGISWNPKTVGALEHQLPGLTVSDVEAALVSLHGSRTHILRGPLRAETLQAAGNLLGLHAVASAHPRPDLQVQMDGCNGRVI